MRVLGLGDELVARIDVNFLSYDTPVARWDEPSAAFTEEKREWGSTRLARWFGPGTSSDVK